MTRKRDEISLKWGTLKSVDLYTKKCADLLEKYHALGSSTSVMVQNDTPEQKEIICQMIDTCNATKIYLDWDDRYVPKEEAKEYVRTYGKKRGQKC